VRLDTEIKNNGVGIAWSNDPDAMIEDTKTHRTFFLKKGQTIDEEIKVQAIFKDRVVLSYKGEEIELR
jgi:type II secretory pathway component PulC